MASHAERRPGEVAAIVTDLNLPFGGSPDDGLGLIRRLRAEPRFARLPILLITATAIPGFPNERLAEGADAFFPNLIRPPPCAKNWSNSYADKMARC